MPQFIRRIRVYSLILIIVTIVTVILVSKKNQYPGIDQNDNNITQFQNEENVKESLETLSVEPVFLENEGQAPEYILYYYKNKNSGIYFTSNTILFQNIYPALDNNEQVSGKVREVTHLLKLQNASSNVSVSGLFSATTTFNYLVGDKKNSNISSYRKIEYKNIYPLIDAEFFFLAGNIKYNFIVHPGGNPEDIRLRFEGVDDLYIDEKGNIVFSNNIQKLKHLAPASYQNNDFIESEYELLGDNTIGFKLGTYDYRGGDLIIDPILQNLSYSSYLDPVAETINDVFVSDDGIYAIGYTSSGNTFPTTNGAYDRIQNGEADVFVSKMSLDLSSLIYSTLVGGVGADIGKKVYFDSTSNYVYIGGYTIDDGFGNNTFPTTAGAYDEIYNGQQDIFVSMFTSDLSTLVNSTFFGGSDVDNFSDFYLDVSNNIYVVGQTYSTDIPTTTDAVGTSNNGGIDGFISKLDSTLSSLVASSYFGGSGINENINNIFLDNTNNIFISGQTDSSDFPTTTGAYLTTKVGGGFISKLSNNLTNIIASTFFISPPKDLFVDSTNNIYVVGETNSSNFPTSTNAYQSSLAGGYDGFISKLNSDLTNVLASTYIGGTVNDYIYGLGLDQYNNIFVVGRTQSTDFPITQNAFSSSTISGQAFLSFFPANEPPVVILGTPSQTSASTVTVTATISDADTDITSLIIEHSTDGTIWTSSTLGAVTVDYGSVSTSTGEITGIDTDSDATDPDYTVSLTIEWNIAADLPATSTSTVYLRLVPNDGNENGTTVTSSAFSIDTADPTVPGDLVVSTLASSTISFTFPNTTSSDTNFSEYKIHYDTAASVASVDGAFTSTSDSNLASSTFGGATTSSVFSGLTPNTLYYFNLFAYDSWEHVTSSATEVSTTTLAAVPVSLSSSGVTDSAATLSWGANNNPAGTEYYVTNDPGGAFTSGWTTATSYAFSGLSCGTTYSFHVKARNSTGVATAWSSSLSMTTSNCSGGAAPPAAPPPPPPPPPTTPCDPVVEQCEPVCDPADPTCETPEENQPSGLIRIVNAAGKDLLYTKSKTVRLKVDVTYADQVAFVESAGIETPDFGASSFIGVQSQYTHTLQSGDGKKCVHARFRNSEKQFTYDTYACVILDTTAPSRPTIQSPQFSPVKTEKQMRVSLSGTAEPGATIIITKQLLKLAAMKLDSEDTGQATSAWLVADTTFYTTADQTGNWTYNFTTLFAAGDYTIQVQAEDKAGNLSGVYSTTISVPPVTDTEPVKPVPVPRDPTPKPIPEPCSAETCTGDTNTTGETDGSGGEGSGSDTGSSSGESTESTTSESDIDPTENESQDTEVQEGEVLKQDSSVSISTSTQLKKTQALVIDTVETSVLAALSGVKKNYQTVKQVLKPTVQQVQQVIDNPEVEKTNERIVAPAVVVAGAANVAAGLGFGQVLVYLRYLFTQPFTLLRLRKRKKWGTVYHAFTKQPVDLAIIRLVDVETGRIRESKVTDTEGRYMFVAPKGLYRLEITKPGFTGFSEHLHGLREDRAFTDLYHGETITVSEDGATIAYSVPLDPVGVVRSAKEVIKDHSRKLLRHTVSILGIAIAFLSLLISPTPFVGTLLALHIVFYLLFKKLAHLKLADRYGVVLDGEKEHPLDRVVVRVFDAVYNKLVDTKVTDKKGRYAALVGPSTYYVTYEHEHHEKKQSEKIDFSTTNGGVIARDEKLQPKK